MDLAITLIKGDKKDSKTDYRDSLPVNVYAVRRDILGAQGYMSQYYGLTSFATGQGIDRGGIYNERHKAHYRVSGDKLISISASGVVTVLGTIPGTSQARLSDFYSFNTQAIIADGNMFLYDPSGGFRQIADSDLGNPLDGVWIDNYYFMTDGEYIFHTEISNEASIDPLQYATAEFMPDPSIGVGKTKDNKALVFGRFSIECFENAANPNFAFTRIETRALKIGIVATHAKCCFNDTWFILGGARDEALGIHMINSGASEKISNREIDKIIKKYTESDLQNMRMETRLEDDIIFVLVHLPEETLLFNYTMHAQYGKEVAWTLLKTDTVGDNPYRAINGVYDARNGKWIYGDRNDGTIGYLDESVVTHYGQKVEALLYSPLVRLPDYSIDSLEIDTIPGHTVTDDARVAVSVTLDGVTYGSEYWMDYGGPSEYGQRFMLYRLGYVRNIIGFKFRWISESKMAFGLMQVSYD